MKCGAATCQHLPIFRIETTVTPTPCPHRGQGVIRFIEGNVLLGQPWCRTAHLHLDYRVPVAEKLRAQALFSQHVIHVGRRCFVEQHGRWLAVVH